MSGHERKKTKNKLFLKKIEVFQDERFYDWETIVCFYCALHHVEDFLELKLGQRIKTHTARRSYLNALIERRLPYKNDENFKDMVAAYLLLQSLSEKSRYECVTIKDREATMARTYLDTVEKYSYR